MRWRTDDFGRSQGQAFSFGQKHSESLRIDCVALRLDDIGRAAISRRSEIQMLENDVRQKDPSAVSQRASRDGLDLIVLASQYLRGVP